jgi:hypothetical protein
MEDQELLEDEQTLEEPQAPTSQPQAEPDLDRLRRENDKLRREAESYRKKAREADFERLRRDFPAIEPEDVKGLPLEAVEKVLRKLAQPAQEAAQTAPAVPDAERQAVQDFVAKAGGSAPVAPQTISFEEAKKRGGYTNPEVRKLIAQGLVEGVKPPA